MDIDGFILYKLREASASFNDFKCELLKIIYQLCKDPNLCSAFMKIIENCTPEPPMQLRNLSRRFIFSIHKF